MALYRIPSYLLSVVTLSAASLAIATSPAAASGAKVTLSCGLPNHEVVTCRLSGSGFRPHEDLCITYRVEFTALPLVRGKHPTRVYHRASRTDVAGAFLRPPLVFAVVKYHESYRLTATAIGDRDHAQTTLVAIAQ